MNFIDAHDFSVGLVLRVLGIPAATYYDWRTARRAPSRRAIEDAELLRLIDAIRGEHEFAATYGSPRVWLELRRRGVRVGRKRVERIMRVNDRKGAYLRKGWNRGPPGRTPSTQRRRTCWAATSPPPAEPEVGRRHHAHPHPGRGVAAGQCSRCLLQQGRRLGFRPASDHRAGHLRARLRHLVPRYPRR